MGFGMTGGMRMVRAGCMWARTRRTLRWNEATVEPAERWEPYAGKPGVNRLAYEVDNVAALRERMRAAGYTESTLPNNHPHRRRVYFMDPDGNDWEFVQYLSNDPRERHDYETPDK